MRDIKFRAWVKASKNTPYVMMSGDLSLVFKCNNKGGFEKYHAEDYKLMQYTGLNDKNGVEIYEGDIIHDPLTGKRYTVIFDNGAFRTNGLVECSAFPNDEVIGNIYSNPELLGGSHDS